MSPRKRGEPGPFCVAHDTSRSWSRYLCACRSTGRLAKARRARGACAWRSSSLHPRRRSGNEHGSIERAVLSARPARCLSHGSGVRTRLEEDCRVSRSLALASHSVGQAACIALENEQHSAFHLRARARDVDRAKERETTAPGTARRDRGSWRCFLVAVILRISSIGLRLRFR